MKQVVSAAAVMVVEGAAVKVVDVGAVVVNAEVEPTAMDWREGMEACSTRHSLHMRWQECISHSRAVCRYDTSRCKVGVAASAAAVGVAVVGPLAA